MNRKLKTVIALAAALLILTGGYLAALLSQRGNASAPITSAETVYAVEAADISQLAWTYLDETVALDREDAGTWHYAGDAAFPLNGDRANAMARTLSAITAFSRVASPQADSEYGLDQPQLTVYIRLTDGTLHTLTVGSYTPILDGYYLRVSGDEALYVTDAALLDAFSYGLYDVITCEAIPYMQTPIGLEVSGATSLTLVYDSEGRYSAYNSDMHWFRLEGEDACAVDTDAAQALIETAATLSWEQCVAWDASDAILEAYGLLDPLYTVTVTYEETPTDEERSAAIKAFTFCIGKGDGTFDYARIPGSKMVYLIDAEIGCALAEASPATLNGACVLRLDTDSVCSVEYHDLRETHLLELRDGGCTLDGAPADAAAVQSVLAALNALSVTGYAENDAYRDNLPDHTFLIVLDSEGIPAAAFTLTQYNDTCYAADFGDAKGLLVSKEAVQRLADAWSALMP